MTDTTTRAYSYVRFSTPEQMKGDSFRRQAELSRAYADQHGLDLDETLTFQDLGVSAFRGRNVQEGALGAFVQAVDSGHVPAGSYLLVESLDRLSRDKVQQAFRWFCDILERGVNVATLTDGKLYTQDSLNENFADLLISLTIMFRAHEESTTKSKRVSAAWQQKRDKAQTDGQKLTGKCPGWLRLDSGQGEFQAIESRAEVVRNIFAMTLAGHGKREIARRLSSEEVPTFGRATSWCQSYIRKILDNKAVVGTFQPMRFEVGSDRRRRRVPVGNPIENYFPPVVSKEDFRHVTQLRSEWRIERGRKTATFPNLFAGLAICASCGGPMSCLNKGRGNVYLVCRGAKSSRGSCRYRSWKYENAENFVLIGLKEVRFEELYPTLNRTARAAIGHLEGELVLAKGELERTTDALENTVELLVERPDSVALKTKLDLLECERDRLAALVEEITALLAGERETVGNANEAHEETIAALAEWLQEARVDEVLTFERRIRLHQLLKRTVERIAFAPGEDDCHRSITVTFRGVSDIQRRIHVEAGQEQAVSKRVQGGQEERDGFFMAVHHEKPPSDSANHAGHRTWSSL